MKGRVVAVTGTRNETMQGLVSAALGALNPKPVLVVVGDCPTGVDAEAVIWCKQHGVTPVQIQALWGWFKREKGAAGKAGPFRNSALAHVAHCLGADTVLYVPDGGSVGTYDCSGKCTKLGMKPERVTR